MKLVIGLGNPGEKYKNNRHNVGYLVIDKLSRMANCQGLMAKKTNVFMNDSGSAVKKLINDYSLAIDHLYIVHDDLDIPLGSYKIQFGKGPKEHNGILSIESAFGTKDFWRVRIGIENRNDESGPSAQLEIMNHGKKISGKEYVLQDFTKEEKEKLETVIDKLPIDLINLISK